MYHFLREDRKLRFEPFTPVVVGGTLVYPGEPVLCEVGFHASERAIDALKYAPGPVLCIVELSGEIIHGDDKAVAQERTVSWMQDISPTLHEFACQVAEEALKEHGVTDERSWKAIEVKRLWLKGEATDEELKDAWAAADAAASAARSAAADAAWSAWFAARSAAWYAAEATAWYAAEAAARSAARSAAGSAARSTQNEKLEAMIRRIYRS